MGTLKPYPWPGKILLWIELGWWGLSAAHVDYDHRVKYTCNTPAGWVGLEGNLLVLVKGPIPPTSVTPNVLQLQPFQILHFK